MAAEEEVVEEAAFDVLNSNAKNRDHHLINDSISNAVTRKQIRAAVFNHIIDE